VDETYLVLKSLHIIFVVCWFAALFYIVRLFIYHAEAQEKPEIERVTLQRQYKLMEKRLWYVIGWPAMILTIGFGAWMLFLRPSLFNFSFMKVKLVLVGILVLYHLFCEVILSRFEQDRVFWSSMTLRFWNEVATVFLVAIVFVIELKHEMNWIWGTLIFLGTGIVLMLIVQLVKKLWKK